MENSTRLSDLPPMSDNIQYSLGGGEAQSGAGRPAQYSMPSGGGFAQPPNFPQPQSQSQMRKSDDSGNGLAMGQGQGQGQGTGQGQGLGQGNYMPLNVHPNPFGNASGNENPQWDAIPPPQYDHPPRNPPAQSSSLDMIPNFVPPQPQRLPSRDIPTNNNHYTHDEEIQANYIPPLPSAKVKDYIKEYDETESKRVRDHEITKYRQDWMEDVARSYQIPMLLAILYFIFQMKVVSRVMFAYLGRLGLFYQEDGSLNIYGMGLKSSLFAGVYWALMFVQQSIL
jgi:hypothetical protein